MTRYQKHMQHIHNIGQAMAIENAVMLLTEDIVDFLVKSGIKEGAPILKDIRALSKYEYNPKQTINNE
jgi:hypothetical protein